MSIVTIVWAMVASACLTLASIYLLIWFMNREARAYLFFALGAAATTALAFCELSVMRASTPGQLLAILRWVHIPLFVWLVSITWFVRVYLGAGRPWLAWAIVGLRGFSLLVNLVMGEQPGYRDVAVLRQAPFLGESVTVLSGAPNRLTAVTQLATFLVLVFVADASVTAWRRGERRKALMVGGSVELFLIAGLGGAMAVLWGKLDVPIVLSVFYLGLVAVMAYELSRDVLRASALVDELQASETAVRESGARMGLAVAAADFGLWTRDLASGTVWGSERWRVLFGFDPVQPLSFDEVLQRLHPDDRHRFHDTHARAVAGHDNGRYRSEYRVLLPDGSVRWMASRGRVELDGAARPVRVRGASRDITARKQAEEEIALLRHEIAHAGQMSMMGQLASALVHEINQPLGAIRRNAEAAELFLQRPAADIAEVRAILADIRKDDQRAGAVIDRMGRLLRRQELETRPLQVDVLVREVAALVNVDAGLRYARVHVDIASGLPHVCGDRVQLQQVLLNLMLNAVDALGGAYVIDRHVMVTAGAAADATVEIVVSDRGSGIPTELLSQIFEPFYTTKPHGMGMGLAICRAIVDAHGGRLWARNRDGGGAAFHVALPALAAGDDRP